MCRGMVEFLLSSLSTNLDLDINAELDELDREEFYRLKKARIMICSTSLIKANLATRLPRRRKVTMPPSTPNSRRNGRLKPQFWGRMAPSMIPAVIS